MGGGEYNVYKQPDILPPHCPSPFKREGQFHQKINIIQVVVTPSKLFAATFGGNQEKQYRSLFFKGLTVCRQLMLTALET